MKRHAVALQRLAASEQQAEFQHFLLDEELHEQNLRLSFLNGIRVLFPGVDGNLDLLSQLLGSLSQLQHHLRLHGEDLAMPWPSRNQDRKARRRGPR